MNWDQIEHNWVAMTRRVRPERSLTEASSADLVHPSGDGAETAAEWPEQTSTSALSDLRLIA